MDLYHCDCLRRRRLGYHRDGAHNDSIYPLQFRYKFLLGEQRGGCGSIGEAGHNLYHGPDCKRRRWCSCSTLSLYTSGLYRSRGMALVSVLDTRINILRVIHINFVLQALPYDRLKNTIWPNLTARDALPAFVVMCLVYTAISSRPGTPSFPPILNKPYGEYQACQLWPQLPSTSSSLLLRQ